MSLNASCRSPLAWHNCYSGQIDIWHPSAFSHPAKMSPMLCHRIFDHLEELGLLKPGNTILDPMSGIATTGLVAASRGYASIMVELETKFIELARLNVEYLSKKLCLPGFELPLTILQGDARNLSQLLQERGLVAVSSPPYGNPAQGLDDVEYERKREIVNQRRLARGEIKGGTGRSGALGKSILAPEGYGSTPGQIGSLPDKPIVVTSPPYLDSSNPPHNDDLEARRLEIAKERGVSPDKVSHLDYTKNIAITSPPYAEVTHHTDDPADLEKLRPGRKARLAGTAGDSEGNIGTLPDQPFTAITSPPYEDSDNRNPSSQVLSEDGAKPKVYFNPRAEGQIGQEQGQTYLEAMAQVYAEIAKVADVLVVVVKNPTRNGKLRRLDLDTIYLLEHCAQMWYCCCRIHEEGIDAEKGTLQKDLSHLREADNRCFATLPKTQDNKFGNTEADVRTTQRQTEPIKRETPPQDVNGRADSDVRAQKRHTQSLKGQTETRPSGGETSQLEGGTQRAKGTLRENYRVEKSSDEGIGEGQFHLSPVRDRNIPGSPHQGVGSGGEHSQSKGLDNSLPTMSSVSSQRPTGQDVQLVCPKCGKPSLPVGKTIQDMSWKVICRHRAILFTEETMAHLFEGQVKKPRGRLSFFKRLSYQKGSPVAMWEDVLVAVKSGAAGLCAVTSPPYGNPRDTTEEYDDKYDLRRPPGVKWGRESFRGRYGNSPGQIGELKDG